MSSVYGEKGGNLGERGLYAEVKAVLMTVADELAAANPDGAGLLRSVSPLWLRHAYMRTLVVDQRIPLPAHERCLVMTRCKRPPPTPGRT